MELRQEQLKEELKSQVAFRKCGGRPGEEDVGEGVAEPAGRALWKGGSSHSPLLLARKWGATFEVKKKKKKQRTTFRVVQWLRPRTSTVGSPSSIPVQG